MENASLLKEKKALVYLIPCELYEGVTDCLPAYLVDAVKDCSVFFVEQERTARRFLKRIWKEMVIDAVEWHGIHKAEPENIAVFKKYIAEKRHIAILSEAGCPGIADPGQQLVAIAQEMGVTIKPLVGPSSILLALMASGLNGQSFRFRGYLPIENNLRQKMLLDMQEEIRKQSVTQLFIETPYRNDALFKNILTYCDGAIKLCVATDLTASTEMVCTKTIKMWKASTLPQLHKRPTLFLLG